MAVRMERKRWSNRVYEGEKQRKDDQKEKKKTKNHFNLRM